MIKNGKIIAMSTTVIILISVINILTFTKYEKIIKDNEIDNLDIAFYKGNEKINDMPTKDNSEGLVFIDGECDNGASIEWNKEEWAPLIKNLTKSKTKCTLYFNDKYIDRELNGTDPVLSSKLIPITISEENGHVTRADEKEKWYDYENQKWANAVILRDGKSDPGTGVEISENDIESYFVWIPRYRYQIFDEGNYNGLTTKINKEQIINVIFESKDVKPQTGSKEGEWLTHPAFTAFNTNGIWVGKFETGYDGAENTLAAEVNPVDENASIEATNKVVIKPNVYSWRSIQVSKAYTIGRYYESTLNSHMMKNSEWGAVAYLSQSKYGSHVSVRINNNSNYLTGYAARQEPTIGNTKTNELCSIHPDACNEYGSVSVPGSDGTYNTNYFNKASVVASTTRNYTGVYDMSGGAWEYMMSGIDDNSTGDGHTGKLASGRHNLYNSGFKGKLTCPQCNDSGVEVNHEITEITEGIDLPTDTRYYDKYDYSTSDTTYNRGHLGDATKEMGPFYTMKFLTLSRNLCSWFNDDTYFAHSGFPWIARGGNFTFGTGAGLFNFNNEHGHLYSFYSYRLVLAF